uniref:Uncharacterized protein n=1 Tax=Lepeophtheirus salmonis TaxID=72036 RepID=A0A0K2TUN6_LEPSM
MLNSLERRFLDFEGSFLIFFFRSPRNSESFFKSPTSFFPSEVFSILVTLKMRLLEHFTMSITSTTSILASRRSDILCLFASCSLMMKDLINVCYCLLMLKG